MGLAVAEEDHVGLLGVLELLNGLGVHSGSGLFILLASNFNFTEANVLVLK